MNERLTEPKSIYLQTSGMIETDIPPEEEQVPSTNELAKLYAINPATAAKGGGQKQRAAIARALIHDRSILPVDEGAGALDQKNADIVEKSLLSDRSRTLILVSHHLTPERKEQFTKVYDLQPAVIQPLAG